MNISAKNLPGILQACRDAGVTKLKAGTLEIEFTRETVVQSAPNVSETTSEPISLTAIEDAETDRNVRANLEAIDEIVENLHITDPEQFEQLQLEHELEPDGGSAQH